VSADDELSEHLAMLSAAYAPAESTAHDDLVAAIVRALAECDERTARGPSSANLPEMLREALEEVADELGGVLRLVEHRPGSWEAQHVTALAAGAMTALDYQSLGDW
jgi:hypothetical protein